LSSFVHPKFSLFFDEAVDGSLKPQRLDNPVAASWFQVIPIAQREALHEFEGNVLEFDHSGAEWRLEAELL